VLHTPARRPHAPTLDRAFTLIELLVVIAVISILMAMVFTALQTALDQGERASCSSNLRQWGIGLRQYAVANKQFYPYDLDGRHVSWVGKTVKKFCADYLLPMGEFGGSERMAGDHIIHCPTQEWHRIYGSDYTGAPGTAFGGTYLVGYFYLPHRNPASCNYTFAGNAWVAKRRITSGPVKAPIMMDMKQYAANGQGWFLDGSLPWSSHVDETGEPKGGNFLFADGRVQWYDTSKIALGATVGSWEFHYKIPLD